MTVAESSTESVAASYGIVISESESTFVWQYPKKTLMEPPFLFSNLNDASVGCMGQRSLDNFIALHAIYCEYPFLSFIIHNY